MAVNSTSSSTTTPLTGSSGSLGGGTVIDVNAIVSKLDSVEQAPIDKLNTTIAAKSVSITDLGAIKSKMSLFQAALQDFTDVTSYLNKTVTSSDSAVSAKIIDSSIASAGSCSIVVQETAKTATSTFLESNFDFTGGSSITFSQNDPANPTAQTGISQTFPLAGSPNITSLEALRDAINSSSSTLKMTAAIVDVGLGQRALSLKSSSVGGLDNGNPFIISANDSTNGVASFQSPAQSGSDAQFTVDGQSFTRKSNSVNDVIPGVTLQLTAKNTTPSVITVSSDNTTFAKTLLSNVGQAYNDLIASFTELTKFDSDPTKRGSLYGDPNLKSMIDSISMSFMTPLTKLGTGIAAQDTSANPHSISFTSLGLEMQMDGTMKFNAAVYDNAVKNGAFEQIAQGITSPTRTYVDSAMLYGGTIDSDIASFTDQNTYLQNQVKELQTRKDEKMAKYREQYAALDALLFQLQSTNTSLSATFNALNNQKNN